MGNALLILPDFALILFGWLLVRFWGKSFDRGFWAGAERLVYFLLFPILLFTSINTARFSFADDGRAVVAAMGAFAVAAILGFAAQPLLRPAPDVFASAVQTTFRFNSYIGLAVAQSLFGAPGVALLALIMAVCVPTANFLAVTALARHSQTGLLRELVRNPLIIGTVAGLATNLLGWTLPPLATQIFGRLGGASVTLGLMCIGAGLTLNAATAEKSTLGYFIFIKLLIFPLAAYALIKLLGLQGLQAQLVIMFAALPTASTAYVLAARMGGTAAPVAFVVTAQTLLSMLTLPMWVALAPH